LINFELAILLGIMSVEVKKVFTSYDVN